MYYGVSYPYHIRKDYIAMIGLPENLYSSDYFFHVDDFRSYYVFTLMCKNIVVSKFIYYYSSSLYYYEIDDKLNIYFYKKDLAYFNRLKHVNDIYDSYLYFNYVNYAIYQKSDGSIYYKTYRSYLNTHFKGLGYVNSYGHKLISYYSQMCFNFKC